MDEQPRTLPAYADPQGKLHVWCDHCKAWHEHTRGAGRKTAGCPDKASPYWRFGYVLRYAGAWSDEVRARHE